jgi:hypothetical protein
MVAVISIPDCKEIYGKSLTTYQFLITGQAG